MEMILCLKVQPPVVSFRRPLDHNYQRTLPLPPPTTLIGLAGSALGLPDRELWTKDSLLDDVKLSVWMDQEPGRASDMWTLLKIKNGKMERSPYVRELLFNVSYTIIYSADEQLLTSLNQAFQNPAYPLSLGREDELILVEDITIDEASPGEPTFYGTVIAGDVRKMHIHPMLEPGIQFEPPIIEELPLNFSVDNKRLRHPQNYATLSFLPFQLKMEISGLQALKYQGRNFVWMNC